MYFVSTISVTLCVNYIVSSLGYLGTDHQLFFFLRARVVEGRRGRWLDNLKKKTCTAKTAEVKLCKESHGGKKQKTRASAFHYPGLVFDFLKRFLQ